MLGFAGSSIRDTGNRLTLLATYTLLILILTSLLGLDTRLVGGSRTDVDIGGFMSYLR